MKSISRWGKNHKQLTRLIIILSFILLTFLGIVTGTFLTDFGITTPAILFLSCILVYLMAVVTYPDKSLKGKKITHAIFYTRQKTCDLLLAISTFFMIICLANDPQRISSIFNPLYAATPAPVIPKDSSVKKYASFAAFSASLKDENGKSLKWKEKKKLLKTQIRAIKKADDLSKGGKVALIILSVLAAIGLIYLVAALACSISCNGSEAAAIIVGVGGAALIIFLLIVAIRAITGKKKKELLREDPAKTN